MYINFSIYRQYTEMPCTTDFNQNTKPISFYDEIVKFMNKQVSFPDSSTPGTSSAHEISLT